MSVSHAQLKAFHAVAVHGSFTKAAERLFLTQPAISDQVRKLEERFGVLLFHRNKRSVRLTDLALLYDTSGTTIQPPRLVARCRRGSAPVVPGKLPVWAAGVLAD